MAQEDVQHQEAHQQQQEVKPQEAAQPQEMEEPKPEEQKLEEKDEKKVVAEAQPEQSKKATDESKAAKTEEAKGPQYVGVVAGKYQWDDKAKKSVAADDDVVGEAISKYGWSDGKKAVSIYLELDGLDDVPDDAISVENGEKDASLTIAAVGNPAKRRRLTLSGLYGEIAGASMVRKRGKNKLVLKLQKKEEKSWWKLLNTSSNGPSKSFDDDL